MLVGVVDVLPVVKTMGIVSLAVVVAVDVTSDTLLELSGRVDVVVASETATPLFTMMSVDEFISVELASVEVTSCVFTSADPVLDATAPSFAAGVLFTGEALLAGVNV